MCYSMSCSVGSSEEFEQRLQHIPNCNHPRFPSINFFAFRKFSLNRFPRTFQIPINWTNICEVQDWCYKLQANIQIVNLFAGLRSAMLTSLKQIEGKPEAGMFINSCFAHCQSELQDTWFAPDSPMIHDKVIVIYKTKLLYAWNWKYNSY